MSAFVAPEISSGRFHEVDESRGMARGFSIETAGPWPMAGPGTSSPTGATNPAAAVMGAVSPLGERLVR